MSHHVGLQSLHFSLVTTMTTSKFLYLHARHYITSMIHFIQEDYQVRTIFW